MKLLRHLLRSPGFLVGALLLLATLLLAFLPPLLMELDTSRRVGLAYVPPTSGRWLGTDHLGLDMFALLVSGLRSSLYVGFLAGFVATGPRTRLAPTRRRARPRARTPRRRSPPLRLLRQCSLRRSS